MPWASTRSQTADRGGPRGYHQSDLRVACPASKVAVLWEGRHIRDSGLYSTFLFQARVTGKRVTCTQICATWVQRSKKIWHFLPKAKEKNNARKTTPYELV